MQFGSKVVHGCPFMDPPTAKLAVFHLVSPPTKGLKKFALFTSVSLVLRSRGIALRKWRRVADVCRQRFSRMQQKGSRLEVGGVLGFGRGQDSPRLQPQALAKRAPWRELGSAVFHPAPLRELLLLRRDVLFRCAGAVL